MAPIAIPNVFAGNSPDAISKLDTDFSTIQSYINSREVTLGLLANRPAAGNAGAWFLATDTNGGTLYVDNGAVWTQAAVGVNATRSGEYTTHNLVGANNTATPNTKYDLTSADLVQLRNPTDGTIIVKTAVGLLTCDLTVAQAVNGRDTAGALATGAFVHFYYIVKADGTGLGTLGSATAPPTGPALPTGYTHWAYAAAVQNAAGPALVKTNVLGGTMYYQARVLVLNGGASVVEAAVSLTTAIPPNALAYQVSGRIFGTSTAAGNLNVTGDLRFITGLIAQQHSIVSNGVAIASVDVNSWGSTWLPNIGQSLIYIMAIAFGTSPGLDIYVTAYRIPNGGE